MYDVQAGDTFETIARKVYGDETKAGLLAKANPGSGDTPAAGSTVVTPATGALSASVAADDPDEVAVIIDGQPFRFWTGVRIRRTLDAPSTIQLLSPFEPDNPSFRETFTPVSYKPLAVAVGGAPLFTGTMVTSLPRLTAEGVVTETAGYSLPGVLHDCTPPASAFPLEYNKLDVLAIARDLAAPFGVQVEAFADVGATFERVAVEPGETIGDFVATLARQRGRVIGDTPAGAWAVTASVEPGKPVARLREEEQPLVSVSPRIAAQQYHSHVTGLEAVNVGTKGSQHTVTNPHLKGVLRPTVIRPADVKGGDIVQATEAHAGRMFGNMIAYDIEVATWRDPQGDLWTPGTTLTLEAPGAMVYSEYEFEIRTVEFTAESDSRSAVLSLTLPGAFGAKIPERLPWAS